MLQTSGLLFRSGQARSAKCSFSTYECRDFIHIVTGPLRFIPYRARVKRLPGREFYEKWSILSLTPLRKIRQISGSSGVIKPDDHSDIKLKYR